MTDTISAPRGRTWVRALLVVVCGLIAAMWVYAFVFASKEAVNRVGDRAWANRAQATCLQARAARVALAVPVFVDAPTAEDMAARADVVDRATDIVERMLAQITESLPADAKGMAIVPKWAEDYRVYIGDRRAYTLQLRRGENHQFAETAIEEIPVSEKLATFAGDNSMPACAPPDDLAN